MILTLPWIPYHRLSTAPLTSSTSSGNTLSPVPSLVTQSRVSISSLTHRREHGLSRTPSAPQQHDREDFDMQNASRLGASYRRGVLSNDPQSSHNQSSSRASVTTPVSGTGPGAQGQGGGGGGGSYRGYGSSPGILHPSGSGSGSGSGSKAGLMPTLTKEYPSAYDTPYTQERSPKAFKTYNVSPMIDANSPGTEHVLQRLAKASE